MMVPTGEKSQLKGPIDVLAAYTWGRSTDPARWHRSDTISVRYAC